MNRRVAHQIPQQPTNHNFYKINEIVNSIYSMNAHAMETQLNNCAKIVGQLLQNDLIAHMNSMKAVKLLAYELTMFIMEQSVAQKPRITLLENAFGQNKKIRFTASLKNNLVSISEVLDNLIWNSDVGKKRNLYHSRQQESEKLEEKYREFQYLLQEFHKYLNKQDDQDTQYSYEEIKKHKTASQQLKQLKKNQKDYEQQLQQNEALIEQLEQIVSKKQRRIKQLTEEMEESIIEQKQMEDLIDELQQRNISLNAEVKLLNEKLAEKDMSELSMKEIVEEMQGKLIIQQRNLSSVKKIYPKAQNNFRTRFTIEDMEEDRRQFKELFQISSPTKICEECLKRKEEEGDNDGIQRMLFTQALSIQAMI